MAQNTRFEHGPSWWAAENIRLWRKAAGYRSAEALAEKVSELGVPMHRAVMSNIENHRREALTVEELCAFALALNVSPSDLVIPHDDAITDKRMDPVRDAMVLVTPTIKGTALFVRDWFHGKALPHRTMTEEEATAFQRHAPAYERRASAASRHPAMLAINALRGFVRDAVIGPTEVAAPKRIAESLRDHAARVGMYVDLLADETEEREDWGDLVTDPRLRADIARQIKKDNVQQRGGKR